MVKKLLSPYLLMALVAVNCLLAGCSSIKTPVNNQYRLSAYSQEKYHKHPTAHSILVNKTEAVAGYQTEQMQYVKKPYELTPFGYNAWIDPPADMLFPLFVQSLQASGYFFAVASSPTAESTDYRLDSQLLELHQSFLHSPSEIVLKVKVVLTQVTANQVIASAIIKEQVVCSNNTPYGGVVAANQAAERMTKAVTQFVIHHIPAG